MSVPEQPPTAEGRVAGMVSAVKGLTLTNVLIIFLLLLMAAPAYFAYQLINDPALLDRFLSSYTENPDENSGCTIRSARVRGGPWRWSIGMSFAGQGRDSWAISVMLPAEPDAEDVKSYCAALNLIVDKMLFGQ